MRCSRADVDKMLLDLQEALCANKMQVIPRKKNMLFMSERGLLWADVRKAMAQLTYNEYYSGPEEDWDFPEDDKFWKFKLKIDKETIYIKFKILYQADGSVRVVSFHLDEP